MKGRNPSSIVSRLVALGATATATEFELVDNKPPTEFRIFRAGVNTSDKGDFVFDDEAAAMVMSAYAKKANTLTMDYEHQALADPPIEAPASAYSWTPEVRNGELWATNVKWTERAAGMIEAREYTRFSPAFFHDRKTMRVQKILNMALTNVEALDGIEPLMAASATTTTAGEIPMAKKMQCKACLKALKAPTDDEDGDEVMCTACGATARLNAVVGLKASAHESELTGELAALAGLRTNVIALTGEKTAAAALGTIEAWKTKALGYDKLAAESAERETATLSANFKVSLDALSTNGQVEPAKRAEFEILALKFGAGRPSQAGVEFLTSLAATLPKKVTTTATTETTDPAARVTLSPVALNVASQMKLDPADVALFRSDRPAWEKKQREAATRSSVPITVTAK